MVAASQDILDVIPSFQDLLGFPSDVQPTAHQAQIASDRINRLLDHPEFTDELAEILLFEWRFWARPEQLSPEEDWMFWLIKSGRGFGKTKSGVEWLREQEELGYRWLGIVAETEDEFRSVIIEGPAGIHHVCPPWNMPHYEPSKKKLTWKSGAVANLYSGDKPGQLRGPQHEKVYADELAKWKHGEECMANIEFGLRLGDKPQCVITTTPRNIKVVRDLIKNPRCFVTEGTTFDNRMNLAKDYIDYMRERWLDTPLGNQELRGHLLSDIKNALWTRTLLQRCRLESTNQVPNLSRCVVAIDPQAAAATLFEEEEIAEEGSGKETGIVTCGRSEDGQGYTLDDRSGDYNPEEWGMAAIDAYHEFSADTIVAERNNGGALVARNIEAIDPHIPVKLVWASRGKITRAEPVATLYRQGKCNHIKYFAYLEDEMTTYTGAPGIPSPNRMDALVWGYTELFEMDQDLAERRANRHRVNRHIWTPPTRR